MTGFFCAKYFIANKEMQPIVVSINQKRALKTKKRIERLFKLMHLPGFSFPFL
jgi:hypothetical protein